METARNTIATGKTFLGIELGSTRIKAVLIGKDFTPLAAGGVKSLHPGGVYPLVR
jgi:sugar (pentulose or hexulose) kinase